MTITPAEAGDPIAVTTPSIAAEPVTKPPMP